MHTFRGHHSHCVLQHMPLTDRNVNGGPGWCMWGHEGTHPGPGGHSWLGECVEGKEDNENHSLGIETKKQYQRLKQSAGVCPRTGPYIGGMGELAATSGNKGAGVPSCSPASHSLITRHTPFNHQHALWDWSEYPIFT